MITISLANYDKIFAEVRSAIIKNVYNSWLQNLYRGRDKTS